MKKGVLGLIAAIAAAALIISLWTFARSSDATGEASPTLASRTLRVAVVPAPPASLYDAGTRRATGHSVDLMNEIARRSGLRIEYMAGNWATMGSALSSRQADVVIGPVFMTEGRAMEYLFARPIYDFAVVPVVAADNTRIASVADIQRPGVRVAVGRGGFDADFVSRFLPRAVVSEFPPDDPNLSMLEVRAGRADLAIVDYGTARLFAAEHPDVRVLENMILSRQYAGFMLRSSDIHLKEFLDVALRNLALSGEMDRINARYAENRIWYAQPDLK